MIKSTEGLFFFFPLRKNLCDRERIKCRIKRNQEQWTITSSENKAADAKSDVNYIQSLKEADFLKIIVFYKIFWAYRLSTVEDTYIRKHHPAQVLLQHS